MKVKLNSKGEWEELENNSPDGIYLDGFLKEKLDNILDIQKREWDAMILIDGKERSGKSILGMTCAWYLSKGKLTINNFARGIEDTKNKIKVLPDKSVLMVDESSLIFNTKESRSKVAVELQKIMDVVGQKNMIFILVLPSVFDLSRQFATRRSLFLLHVVTGSKWERGAFGYYGMEDKEVLYVEGKKNYNKYVIEPEMICSFTKFEPPFYEEYLNLKRETLFGALNGKEENKFKEEMDKLRIIIYKIFRLCAEKRITQDDISEIAGISTRAIRFYGEKGGRKAYEEQFRPNI